jgi:hypothetical protein
LALGDFIRRFFDRKRNPELAQLEAFVARHRGVEGYVEPRTATQSTTLLLVDRDGASIRGAVRDREDAIAFCEHHGLPVYDAAVVGYPKRMVEHKEPRGAASDRVDQEIADLERRLHEGGSSAPDH